MKIKIATQFQKIATYANLVTPDAKIDGPRHGMMLSQPGGLHGFAYHILSNRLRRAPASRPKDLSSITT